MSNYSGQQTGYTPQHYPQQGYNQNYQAPQDYSSQPGYVATPPLQHGAYGQPPQQPAFVPAPVNFPPTPPSPGYDSNIKIPGDARADAQKLQKAMNRLGTDEKTLITILSKPDPLQMALLRETYNTMYNQVLERHLESETSGDFRSTLTAIAVGPLMQDVLMLRSALKGTGTNETMVNDILLGRSNADLNAIKRAYHQKWGRDLAEDVRADLSGKTAELFDMVMKCTRAEDSEPLIADQIKADAAVLRDATNHKTRNTMEICRILTSRSDGQLRAIAHEFQITRAKPLEKAIEEETKGHMKDALLLLLGRATDRAMTDAMQLEDAMAGFGTRDTFLINRVVRIHWNRAHMDQVKRAYNFKYKRDLITRVEGETRGDYEKLLVACLK